MKKWLKKIKVGKMIKNQNFLWCGKCLNWHDKNDKEIELLPVLIDGNYNVGCVRIVIKNEEVLKTQRWDQW